jgi:hypothetical protein
VRRSFLAGLATSSAIVVLTACGVPGAEGDRAQVLARTCASTIARSGVSIPDAGRVDPDRFAEERRTLLASGRQFDTATPFKRACVAIRDEIRAGEGP